MLFCTNELIQKHQPDVVAIEKLFFFINAKTAMAVAESIGVIKLAAESEGTKVESYAPLQIKLVVAGSGRADKKMVKAAVRSILKVRSPKKRRLILMTFVMLWQLPFVTPGKI